ncbi:K+/H+ antiporter subunit F [Larsenimonas salina]|uniref:K+/H+ antiporter subunit F n=1 Tax=Larsenimonas salina TaxID=1295565 RepID=UPI002074229F|nr:K+/H+ antiporter subunit F [Larsenimonas salina]MCM5703926.1 K+/H+ antiporter subunit F [Larsenimonas salina]
MLERAVEISAVLFMIAIALNFYRLIMGPSLPDRIAAVDTMYVNAIGAIVLYGMWLKTTLYFEAALLIAMLGFISTVAVCKYLLRGDIIE